MVKKIALEEHCLCPGFDRVMFAADYPFEATEEAAHFIDGAALSEDVRSDICFNNAVRFLGLKAG
jgi:predicted TIM-barrel fold metal-dependent hydrolase